MRSSYTYILLFDDLHFGARDSLAVPHSIIDSTNRHLLSYWFNDKLLRARGKSEFLFSDKSFEFDFEN